LSHLSPLFKKNGETPRLKRSASPRTERLLCG
jgi:hypothetical protein